MRETVPQPSATARRVRRRQVFYIPGYDPIHPRRYRELYRSEAAAQAALSGYEIALRAKRIAPAKPASAQSAPAQTAPARPGKAPAAGRYGWHVDATIDGAEVAADFEVLVWSDLVRASMDAMIVGTYLQLVRTAWTYVASGALRRLMWLRKGPVIAALYPVAMLIAQLLLALALGALAARLAVWLPSAAVGLFGGSLPGLLAAVLWWLALGAAVTLVLREFKRHDNRFFAYYLMHDYAYTAQRGGANPPELETRMAEFGDRIAAALASDNDEVLVVGHSSGAHLAVSILADLIRQGRVPPDGPALGLLSLGQVIPMVSFLPEARRLRADLHYLSVRDELFWLDVTAPGDGCAFALCDPVAVSGVAPPGQKWPLVISAAFTRTLTPERWKALRWRFFRLHFQYLCAFDNLPGNESDYDYFRVTAGPRTLAARFAARPASASRIDVAASRHVSRQTARQPARQTAGQGAGQTAGQTPQPLVTETP